MVRILRSVYDGIIRHAESGFPHEVCGVLVGADGRITHYRECRNLNTERAHDRYDLDPESFKQADEWARGEGLEILGIYHSHPDHPSIASETDRQRAWPEWIYIIFSINGGKYNDARAWVLEDFDAGFKQIDIKLEEG
ncbi:MAG TPA: M67 family metallopeptidase [Thermodesulfobacteriota bacterium]|nr:M67 family metallopeptidase [Thermodesulfobacteriota bacterium]